MFADFAFADLAGLGTFPTIHVLNGLRKEGFLPFSMAQSRTRHEDRREFPKHLLRFRHVNHLGSATVGTEFPEIVLVNSHDGTSSYQMDAGIYRLVCSNGMVVSAGDVQSLKVSHKGDVRDQVIEAAYEIVESFPVVQSKMTAMKETKLLPAVQEALAEEAIQLRYNDPDKPAPITAAQVLTPERAADVGNDAWSVLNRTQEHLIRGDLSGTAANGTLFYGELKAVCGTGRQYILFCCPVFEHELLIVTLLTD